MTKYEALEVLSKFNKWRRGEIDEIDFTPKQIGDAIDFGILFLNESVMHTMAEGSCVHTQLKYIVGAVRENAPKYGISKEREVVDFALDIVSTYKKSLVKETQTSE